MTGTNTITFIECPIPGYPARTRENVKRSQATLAFAKNFKSAGEKLTERLCHELNKIYIQINITDLNSISSVEINNAVAILNSYKHINTINIAGNSIATLNTIQDNIDRLIFNALNGIEYELKIKPNMYVSGGQSGVDEAGLKAAIILNKQAMCVAPKYWMFRTRNNMDISDKDMFIGRFKDFI